MANFETKGGIAKEAAPHAEAEDNDARVLQDLGYQQQLRVRVSKHV